MIGVTGSRLVGLLAGLGALFFTQSIKATEGAACPACPTLVTIAPGTFFMGARSSEPGLDPSELPRRRVVIRQAFQLGQTEVTVAQFDAFARATGREATGGCRTLTDIGWRQDPAATWRTPGLPSGPDYPVTCVSWLDAQAYLAWLQQETGDTWRLPTEAEWEFAARAGSSASNYWGDDTRASCDHANINDLSGKNKTVKVAEPCDDGYQTVAPVGRFRPNAHGLHDVQGNVWEWVKDCWAPGFAGAPADGTAHLADPCEKRVMRGRPSVRGPVLRSGSAFREKRRPARCRPDWLRFRRGRYASGRRFRRTRADRGFRRAARRGSVRAGPADAARGFRCRP